MNKNQKLYPFKFEAGCPVLDENSTIINGFLSENSIDDVLDTYLGEIAGNDNFQYYKGLFPLKVSFKSSFLKVRLYSPYIDAQISSIASGSIFHSASSIMRF